MIFPSLIGSVFGVLAALIPGFHTNLIAVLISSFSIDAWPACVFLVSVAVARSVADAVPTVFLGVADEQNVLALLPGQRLAMRGAGVEAVKFSVIGSVFGVLAGILLVPFFVVLFPLLFGLIRPFLFWILLVLVFILLLRSKSVWAWVVFCLAGILGFVVLHSVRRPLFPLLSGLFGSPALLMSLFEKVELPLQFDVDVLRLPKRALVGAVSFGVLAGSFVTLFPGLSPSQAAALVHRKRHPLSYLVLIGALGTVDVLISLVTFFVLQKSRNGAVVVIEQLVGKIPVGGFLALLASALLACGIASSASLFFSRFYARLLSFVDYGLVCASVLSLLLALSFILSGWLGVLTFISASFLGLIPPLTGISRSHAMGCLLVPTLFFLKP